MVLPPFASFFFERFARIGVQPVREALREIAAMAVTDALAPAVGTERRETRGGEFASQQDEEFNVLVCQHREAVYRVAVRLTHRHEDADDLVQETFLRAYASLGHFRGDASTSTWLYRIVTNLALNHMRRRARFERIAGLFCREPSAVGPASVESDETRRAVHAALEALPASQRAVVVLFDMEGLSAAQIAEILDVPEGTVRSRLHHARRHLRRRLSPYVFGVSEELAHASHVS
jgi:RNA polymerase sigma-70 factor (ECF subfamily)